MERPANRRDALVRLVLMWLIVMIPFAWGIYETVIRAAALFQ